MDEKNPVPLQAERQWPQRTNAGRIAGIALYPLYVQMNANVAKNAFAAVAEKYGQPATITKKELTDMIVKDRGIYVADKILKDDLALEEEQVVSQLGLQPVFLHTMRDLMSKAEPLLKVGLSNPSGAEKLNDVIDTSPNGFPDFNKAFKFAWEFTTRAAMFYEDRAYVPVGSIQSGEGPDLVMAIIDKGKNTPTGLVKIPYKTIEAAGDNRKLWFEEEITSLEHVELFQELSDKPGTWGQWIDQSVTTMREKDIPQPIASTEMNVEPDSVDLLGAIGQFAQAGYIQLPENMASLPDSKLRELFFQGLHEGIERNDISPVQDVPTMRTMIQFLRDRFFEKERSLEYDQTTQNQIELLQNTYVGSILNIDSSQITRDFTERFSLYIGRLLSDDAAGMITTENHLRIEYNSLVNKLKKSHISVETDFKKFIDKIKSNLNKQVKVNDQGKFEFIEKDSQSESEINGESKTESFNIREKFNELIHLAEVTPENSPEEKKAEEDIRLLSNRVAGAILQIDPVGDITGGMSVTLAKYVHALLNNEDKFFIEGLENELGVQYKLQIEPNKTSKPITIDFPTFLREFKAGLGRQAKINETGRLEFIEKVVDTKTSTLSTSSSPTPSPLASSPIEASKPTAPAESSPPSAQVSLEEALKTKSLVQILKDEYSTDVRTFPIQLSGDQAVSAGLGSIFEPMIRKSFNIDPTVQMDFLCTFQAPNILLIDIRIPKTKPGEFIKGRIRLIDEGKQVKTEEAIPFEGLGTMKSFEIKAAMATGQLLSQVLKRVNDSPELKGKIAIQGIQLKERKLIMNGDMVKASS